MNDYEKLMETFEAIGLEYKKAAYNETQTAEYDGVAYYDAEIILDNGIGYFHSNCIFYFLNGSFAGHGCWE